MATTWSKRFLLLLHALSFSTMVSSQGVCQDLLGNCAQMPRTLCTKEQSRAQMKKLCAKTCGYCHSSVSTGVVSGGPQGRVPPTTNDIFMLYLKNDVKFLKEEVVDIKARLREITLRQKEQARAISEGRVNGQGAPKPSGSDARTVSVDPVVDQSMVNEILELKRQAQRLTDRLQEQSSRYKVLDAKYSNKLSDTNDRFSDQVKVMRREIDSLAKDLRKYAEQIQQLPDFDGQLEKFRQDSTTRNQELRRVTMRSIDELKNFTNKFLMAQGAFYDELEKERNRNVLLEKKLTDLTDAFEEEKRKTEDLAQLVQVSIDMKAAEEEEGRADKEKKTSRPKKTSDQDSAPTLDTGKFEELVEKFERVNVRLDAQTKRTDILTTLVAALSNNLANTTGEQRNIRRYLAYQYAYIGRHMKGLVTKLDNLENFSQDIINKTISRVSSSTSTREEFSQLSNMVMDIFDQLKSLKVKGYQRQQQRINNNNNNNNNNNAGGTAVVSASALTQGQLEMMQDMAQDVDILKKKVAYGAEWMGTLDVKIAAVANSSIKGIADLKTSIQEMAKLRNNETLSLQNINTKFQQGIAALLGPQRSNSTRFFNPRFDWEDGRLSIYGYVAMSHQGEWGTICDDNFDDKEAQVLCRAAGYKGGVYSNGKYKVGDGTINSRTRTLHRIWIDELHCEGTEKVIEDCQSGSEGWGIHDCDHDEDVGIKCFIS